MSQLLRISLLIICAAGLLRSLPARAHDTLDGARQLVVITTADWNSLSGTLQRFERGEPRDKWAAVAPPFPIVVGKTGLAWGSGLITAEQLGADIGDPVKQEGDGKAPAGVFSLGTAFGYEAQLPAGSRMPYLRLTSSIECVDDVKSRYYNRIVDRQHISEPDWSSSEQMLRGDELYHWGVYVDHNSHPTRPGGGSCIFLHVWRGAGQGTAGCTAMPKKHIQQLIEWLDPAKSPLLVQMPRSQYDKVRYHLGWPNLPAK
ncbi:L,D-transpeptidase [Pandoraea sp. NPDC090278]|uniref:L,D-transpeptidase family protein n=1 Tax=Pandoraea sp. NPDC090278 TaxID=3364391 RepID=UPI00383BB1C9